MYIFLYIYIYIYKISRQTLGTRMSRACREVCRASIVLCTRSSASLVATYHREVVCMCMCVVCVYVHVRAVRARTYARSTRIVRSLCVARFVAMTTGSSATHWSQTPVRSPRRDAWTVWSRVRRDATVKGEEEYTHTRMHVGTHECTHACMRRGTRIGDNAHTNGHVGLPHYRRLSFVFYNEQFRTNVFYRLRITMIFNKSMMESLIQSSPPLWTGMTPLWSASDWFLY